MSEKKIDSTVSYKKPKHLIIDFRNVTFMDSSGIGLVMGRYRLLQGIAPKNTLEVKNVNRQTKKIMELTGLGRIADIKESDDEENK
ncbi:MAG: STAS domain-containing protein [Clostridiales bacterium]|nr:STAS domain-containing protein [Clostridiales bacterium]